MATYYVRPDGNDSNTGTGPGTVQAWATIGKALSATGISSGDTVYVAPGVYSSLINVLMTSATAPTYIVGDPLATQFSGMTPGQVICTNYNNALTASGFANHVVVATSKNFLHWSNINFKFNPPYGINVATVRNWTFEKCTFSQRTSGGSLITMTSPASTAMGLTINQCIFHGGTIGLGLTGGGVSDTTTIRNSVFRHCSQGISQVSCQTAVFNCLFFVSLFAINQSSQSLVFPATITNCLTANCSNDLIGGVTGTLIETYNRLLGTSARSNVDPGTGSVTVGDIGVDIGESLLQGLPTIAQLTSFLNSPNANFGTLTGAPATDMYGVTWTGAMPDAGSGTYRNISSVGSYLPIESNASQISITAGSTSRSLYLYLSATGITATTTGLQAFYTKEDAAPVSIPLVAQTPTGAWVAGGFAEVSAINQPGIYRLDIPDAAISAGYNQTVVTVRGASGTNGAVVTIQDPPERGSAIYMGPYKLISNHMGADNPLEVLKGVQAPVDLQLVDNSGGGVDITGATVTAKIYNASSQLIDTYTCTPTYALDGRCSFNLDTTVTDNSGHYTVTVTRQVGGNIVVFGPLRCLVRAN